MTDMERFARATGIERAARDFDREQRLKDMQRHAECVLKGMTIRGVAVGADGSLRFWGSTGCGEAATHITVMADAEGNGPGALHVTQEHADHVLGGRS